MDHPGGEDYPSGEGLDDEECIGLGSEGGDALAEDGYEDAEGAGGEDGGDGAEL